MVKVLFVCTGNICRSPTAEGIFRKYIEDENLSDQIKIDSAGLIDHHEGDGVDLRSQKHALKRGFDLSQIVSRPLRAEDFNEFDYFIAMDKGHLSAMENFCPDNLKPKKTIKLMLDYSKKWKGQDVPDPYRKGEEGFELVLNMLEESSRELLNEIQKKL